jgi:putative membrane protein
VASFLLGVLLLWLVTDWPIGPLGAGYLVSVHTAKYIVLTMLVAPLAIHGMPRWLLRTLLQPRWVGRLARILTRPIIAFLVFNVVMVVTHLPAVVDTLKLSQLGSFGIDMAWLASGLVFWWQVLGPLPELKPMSYPGRIVFLLLNVFVPTVPASFLTFADYPVYAVYELAPRVVEISAAQDQQLAGLVMKIVGGFIIFGTASVLFFKWYAVEERLEEAQP